MYFLFKNLDLKYEKKKLFYFYLFKIYHIFSEKLKDERCKFFFFKKKEQIDFKIRINV